MASFPAIRPESRGRQPREQRPASKSSDRDGQPNADKHSVRTASAPGARSSTAWQSEMTTGQPQEHRRRDIAIYVTRVDIRMYRRTRLASDVSRCPPHFVYHMRVEWSGPAGERNTWKKLRSSPRASRSQSPDSRRPCSRASCGSSSSIANSPNAGPWWESLPERYAVRRRWQDIARFHEALVTNLAVDPETGCNRVKGKIPILPSKGDLDSWLQAYAATEDACALSRKLPLAPPQLSTEVGRNIQAQMADLDGLHWVYVKQRLAPYFVEVNKILRELPTAVLAGSGALFSLVVPGSAGLRDRSFSSGTSIGRNAAIIRKRFLGTQIPMAPDAEDIAEAWRRQREAKQRASVQLLSPKSFRSANV